MKKLLLLSFLLIYLPARVLAQIYDGDPRDSTMFSFQPGDSLKFVSKHAEIDTTGAMLWRIGTTSKSFFTLGSTSTYAIMTDTTSPYPMQANDWFMLRVTQAGYFNTIISFRHKYQTTAQHDGGAVEYSIDNGNNWMNVLDSCHATSAMQSNSIMTYNFYGENDTLYSGDPAFSGTSNGWQYSRIQFFDYLPLKGTAQNCLPYDTLLVRFRFISDDTTESLAGWIVDDIKLENDHYSAVKDIRVNNSLGIYPNPANDIVFFPELKNEQQYKIEIINSTGQRVLTVPYKHQLDLGVLPRGLYFYRASNADASYTGQLLLE